MNLGKFDAVCAKLPGTTMVVQWGESHVWKIGAKMFALGGVDGLVVKTSPLAFEMLLEQGVATRAPYLPRGNWVWMAWNTGPDDAALRDYIGQSHAIIAKTLPKATRTKLRIPVC